MLRKIERGISEAILKLKKYSDIELSMCLEYIYDRFFRETELLFDNLRIVLYMYIEDSWPHCVQAAIACILTTYKYILSSSS